MATQDLNFGDSTFTGLPKDWPDAKAIICRVCKRAGLSWMLEAGNILFKAYGELEDATDEDQVEAFFTRKGYFKTLMSVKMQVSKKTISHKNAYYESLNDDEKKELEENNWVTYFQDANSTFLSALRNYMAVTKTSKASNARGNNNAQIRSILHNDEVLRVINDDFSELPFDEKTLIFDYPWEQPAVWAWYKLLDLFEGKGKTGVNSYYSTMRTTVGSVNPNRTNATDFVQAKAELESLFATLKTQYAEDVEGLCDRLLSEQLIEMYELLARKPEEDDAWRYALNTCTENQQPRQPVTEQHMPTIIATSPGSTASPLQCASTPAPSRPCVPMANASACSAGSPRHRPIRPPPSPAPATTVGTKRPSSSPWPSRPEMPLPQVQSAPSSVTAAECS